ncbi:hypothetical protein IGB42_02645 [Andreprevotia sp. IGB-42]|uniref:hypothetical protein n=1 Tax=Andreprevotia sp. IGB-42 TaxID=2497473 RepID=UPI00135C6493|nr:hypothetical protein [Andreprevotia sp. IGB-42]KAF0812802.1 hypothetical protein IGB42_02645 [Andreprevotia sp. IGB-42]
MKYWGVALTIIGLFNIVRAWVADVSVMGGGGAADRIINHGLVADRQLAMESGGIFFLAGIVLIVGSQIVALLVSRPGEAATSEKRAERSDAPAPGVDPALAPAFEALRAARESNGDIRAVLILRVENALDALPTDVLVSQATVVNRIRTELAALNS